MYVLKHYYLSLTKFAVEEMDMHNIVHSLYMIPFEMWEAWGSIFYICCSQAVVNLLESDALFLIEPNRCIIDMEQVVFHIRLTITQ